MKRSSIAIILLSLALLLTNGWWFWQVFDSGVTATYRQAALDEHHEALAQGFLRKGRVRLGRSIGLSLRQKRTTG